MCQAQVAVGCNYPGCTLTKNTSLFLVAGLSHLALYRSDFHNLAAAILRHFHQTAIPLITRIILSACGHPSTRACVFSLTFGRLVSQVFFSLSLWRLFSLCVRVGLVLQSVLGLTLCFSVSAIFPMNTDLQIMKTDASKKIHLNEKNRGIGYFLCLYLINI